MIARISQHDVDPAINRRNGSLFLISNLLIYLAAPVIYVDVVQAALLDKLGTSVTIANIPASAYLFGSFVPIFLSWVVPYRLERGAVIWSNLVTAASLTIVLIALTFPVINALRIGAVVVDGLVQGCSASVTSVYLYQCLGRGTTPEWRARTLKLTLTFTPIAAVVGSLGAQFIMNGNLSFLHYPYDFAFLYFFGVLCTGTNALVATRYRLAEVKEVDHPPFFKYIVGCVRSFSSVRALAFLWLAYVLCYSTLAVAPNLSVYSREAVGREPKELIGFILALRFGFKSLTGYVLGIMLIRWGARAPVLGTMVLACAAVLWAWMVPGYWYLLAFGFLGAAELGGNYFINYVITASPTGEGARNQSLLLLAAPAASLSPVLHGFLTDKFGFPGSFLFGSVAALLGLLLILKISPRPVARRQMEAQMG